MATFTNQATLSYNNTVTRSNIVTGELVDILHGDQDRRDRHLWL